VVLGRARLGGGRPADPAPHPAAAVDHPLRTSVAIAATLGLTTWPAPCLAWSSTRPSGPVILATPNGAARRPPAARVAYAAAISSGVTSPVPSTALGTARSGLSTPIRAAASTTALAPRSGSPPPRRSSSPALTVLIDRAVAVRRVALPKPWPS